MFDSSTQSRSNAQLEGMISPLTFFKAKLEAGAILAIGEAHWYGELFEKMTDVLLDAELDGVFSHLFIEFGNAKHQALLNNYLMGEMVTDAELAAVWLDSVAFPAWLHPCYGQFFQRLRAANPQRKVPINVVLTEPAFQWQDIAHAGESAKINAQRDQALVDGVEKQAVKGDRGVVVLVGARHILKRSPTLGFMAKHKTFGDLAQQKFAQRYVSVWPHILTSEFSHTEHGIYATTQPKLSQKSFLDLIPKKPPVNPYAFISLDKLVDAYWYLGPQRRQLDAQGVNVPLMWKSRLEQRLPLVNERQQMVIKKVIE
ncbi:hypothetical protein [Vibrio campbellii]|uniref:hypothetical protein n=1 Tax=Vibrio campbellii TaxID=680 RepID=UPI001E312716|nr:hypothetical protein [Vibrio campbellii]MCC8252769.1 hypothetical protein [Vibrio campbellii CAIM 333]